MSILSLIAEIATAMAGLILALESITSIYLSKLSLIYSTRDRIIDFSILIIGLLTIISAIRQ